MYFLHIRGRKGLLKLIHVAWNSPRNDSDNTSGRMAEKACVLDDQIITDFIISSMLINEKRVNAQRRMRRDLEQF